MAERATTTTIIMKIEETQKLMGSLIKYYKDLEDLLKGTPAQRNAGQVRKYLKKLRDDYLERFKYQMEKLRKKAKEEERKRREEAKKMEEQARKILERSKEAKKGAKKLRRI